MNKRLASLDALRGFDMFFITGGSGIIFALATLGGENWSWLAVQMSHVAWTGFHHHDTIFPLFLFLAGVSWPFSLSAQREKGKPDLRIHLRILCRTAALFALGMTLGGVLKFNPQFRIPSVLGFIGVSWGLSALIFMHVEKNWKRFAVVAGLVLSYFTLQHFGGDYSKEGNIIRLLDLKVMPNHLFRPGDYDPESLLAVPGGMIIALLGMMSGKLLRSEKLSAAKKVVMLFGAAASSLAFALFFIYVLGVPMVKALWTVSFDFAALAYSFGLLALFYLVVDVFGLKRWTILFDPIGKNSILVYMCSHIGIWIVLQKFFFGGLCESCGDWNNLVHNLTYYLTILMVAWYFREKRAFLKV